MKLINDIFPIQVSRPVHNIVDDEEEEAKGIFFAVDIAVP
jgi:hypothetical protein